MVETERPKSGCLTAFVVLMALGGLMGASQSFLGRAAMEKSYQQLHLPMPPGWVLSVQGLLALLNIAAAVGIWQYKKWGVYLYGALAVLSILLMLYSGMSPFILGFSLIGPLILFFLVRPHWDHFEG
jgi:hypothetical protein